MKNTTRPSCPRLKNRQQRRLKRIRVRVRPITILAKAAACRVRCSADTTFFATEAAAVATVAMAKAASNIARQRKQRARRWSALVTQCMQVMQKF
jgi:hypothetical protein